MTFQSNVWDTHNFPPNTPGRPGRAHATANSDSLRPQAIRVGEEEPVYINTVQKDSDNVADAHPLAVAAVALRGVGVSTICHRLSRGRRPLRGGATTLKLCGRARRGRVAGRVGVHPAQSRRLRALDGHLS